MTDREWALLLHLAGIVLLFSGILATAALLAARQAVADPKAGDRILRA